MSTGTLSCAGRSLAYSRDGEGPQILLLHGIPTNRGLWRDVAPLLIESGFEVLAIDLLGYGDSDKPLQADLGIKAQAELLSRALPRLGWQRGMVVGHDIGGGITQLLAIDHPDLISAMVLVDTIAYDSFPEPGIARLKDPVWDGIFGDPNFNLTKGFAKALQTGIVNPDHRTAHLVERYERPFRGVEGRLAYLRAARALRTEELSDRMAEIERSTVPTLILWGDQDAFQDPALGKRLASTMPHARFEAIENAGHFLPEDKPESLGSRILAFATESRTPAAHEPEHGAIS
jgi:pimeloyl-ACP methyl ester carboxylesterase